MVGDRPLFPAARGGGKGSLPHGPASAVIQHLRPGRRETIGNLGGLSRSFSALHGVQELLPRPARRPPLLIYLGGRFHDSLWSFVICIGAKFIGVEGCNRHRQPRPEPAVRSLDQVHLPRGSVWINPSP